MSHSKLLQPLHAFFKRLARNLFLGVMIIAFSLGIGIFGYMHFEKMDLVSAYENAAMILSGMGPVDSMKTESGKIFAGSYALFSGVVFLVVIAVIIAPVFHRFFHKFIITQTQAHND